MSATSNACPSGVLFRESSAPVAPHTLHVDKAENGLGLVLQTGVRITCTTGIPLMKLLHDELGLDREQTGRLDVFLLDGKPVDTPTQTLVPDGARLALAAGLPGIAGLAMKSNSAVRGLRPGITHGAGKSASGGSLPTPGCIELVLYSLALKELAAHFLRLGVGMTVGKLLTHLPCGLRGECTLDGDSLNGEEALRKLEALPPQAPLYLSACISGS